MEFRILDTYAMIPVLKQKDSDSEKLNGHAGSSFSRLGKIAWEIKPSARNSVLFMSGGVRKRGRNMTFSNRGNS